jgi:hypothetical protein
MTGDPEVEPQIQPGQKSTSGRLRLMSPKPVSGKQSRSDRMVAQNESRAAICDDSFDRDESQVSVHP